MIFTWRVSSPNRPGWLCGTFSLLFGWYRGSFPGVQRPGRRVDHSPPSSPQVKNEWSYTSVTPISLHGVNRDDFTFLRRYGNMLRTGVNCGILLRLMNLERYCALCRQKVTLQQTLPHFRSTLISFSCFCFHSSFSSSSVSYLSSFFAFFLPYFSVGFLFLSNHPLLFSLTSFFLCIFFTCWLHICFLFYVWVSVHHNSILYKEPTRCNFGSIVY